MKKTSCFEVGIIKNVFLSQRKYFCNQVVHGRCSIILCQKIFHSPSYVQSDTQIFSNTTLKTRVVCRRAAQMLLKKPNPMLHFAHHHSWLWTRMHSCSHDRNNRGHEKCFKGTADVLANLLHTSFPAWACSYSQVGPWVCLSCLN